jgi:hypothetical protein
MGIFLPKFLVKNTRNSNSGWFGPYRIRYCLPNNIVLLMTIDKLDLNFVLVNINKLKPYRFVGYHTFQLVLAKPNDLLPKKLVETNHFGNIFTKESVKTNHSSNLFTKEPTKTNQSSNLFTKELVEFHISF